MDLKNYKWFVVKGAKFLLFGVAQIKINYFPSENATFEEHVCMKVMKYAKEKHYKIVGSQIMREGVECVKS